MGDRATRGRRAKRTAAKSVGAPAGAATPLVFRTWSGERSRQVALALHDWLKKVVQADPWMSARDIDGGDFWDDEIRQALDSACFGIVCVTVESAVKPWVNYEAGAIAHRLGKHVCPYLFGVEPNALQAMPLARLQALPADEEGTIKLVASLNRALGERAVHEQIVEGAVKTYWSELKAKLEQIPAPEAPPKRTTDETLAEILSLVQAIAQRQNEEPVARGGEIPYAQLGRLIRSMGPDWVIDNTQEWAEAPLSSMMGRFTLPGPSQTHTALNAAFRSAIEASGGDLNKAMAMLRARSKTAPSVKEVLGRAATAFPAVPGLDAGAAERTASASVERVHRAGGPTARKQQTSDKALGKGLKRGQRAR